MSAIASHLRILGDTIWVYACLAFFFVALYLLGAETGCLLSETGMNLARMIALFVVVDFAFGSFAAIMVLGMSAVIRLVFHAMADSLESRRQIAPAAFIPPSR